MTEHDNQIIGAPTLGDNWEDWLSPGSHEAANTLKSFAVVPCFDGGIQLEIHRDGVDFELNITRHGTIEGVYIGPASQTPVPATPPPLRARCRFCGDLDGECSCDRKPQPNRWQKLFAKSCFLLGAGLGIYCIVCVVGAMIAVGWQVLR